MQREKETVLAMIGIYCRARHGAAGGLCAGCSELGAYALRKIDRCPFHSAKPTCARCRIHCYSGLMRQEIRNVMRYAGPRMLVRRPWLALLHAVDGLRFGNGQIERR